MKKKEFYLYVMVPRYSEQIMTSSANTNNNANRVSVDTAPLVNIDTKAARRERGDTPDRPSHGQLARPRTASAERLIVRSARVKAAGRRT